MARPIKEGMDYFSHDTDASSDEKIELLTGIYGNDGYAFYFIMLERIYRNKDFCIDVSDAETKEEMFQILSKKIRLSLEEFNKILKTSFKYGLFDKKLYEEKGIITSDGIQKRAGTVVAKRIAMQNRYKKKISDAETKEGIKTETQQSKEKESKEKESKEKESKVKKIKEEKIIYELGGSCSSDFNIYQYMQQRGFIVISPIMAEQVKTDIELYSLEEVKQAIDIADNNGKHTYSYVKGILEKRRAGVKAENDELLEIKRRMERGEDPF